MKSTTYCTSSHWSDGIALDLRERAAGVRVQQIPVGAAQLGDRVGGELSAHQTDGVQTVNPRAIADGLGKRQRILRDDRKAADEGVPADAAELVHA